VPPVRRLGHVGYDQSFVMSSSASAPGPGLFNVSSTPGGAARSARASGSSGGSTTTPETAPHLVIGAYPWAEACALRKPAPGFEIALYALALLTLPATSRVATAADIKEHFPSKRLGLTGAGKLEGDQAAIVFLSTLIQTLRNLALPKHRKQFTDIKSILPTWSMTDVRFNHRTLHRFLERVKKADKGLCHKKPRWLEYADTVLDTSMRTRS